MDAEGLRGRELDAVTNDIGVYDEHEYSQDHIPPKDTTMATFTVIDATQAPRPLQQSGRLVKRMAEYEGYVNSMKPGKVGKLELTPGETMRGVGLRVSRAGKRLGRSVNVWAVDGVVYFKVG